MPEAVLDAAPIVIGGVVLALLGGIVWWVKQMHGLIYKATNGDENSVPFLMKQMEKGQADTLKELRKHHRWAVNLAKADRKRRGDSP